MYASIIILLGQVSFICGHTAGFVPLVLTVNVSPPGGHSVRIVASSGGEDTVSYTISDTKTEGENRAIVPLHNLHPVSLFLSLSDRECSSTGGDSS